MGTMRAMIRTRLLCAALVLTMYMLEVDACFRSRSDERRITVTTRQPVRTTPTPSKTIRTPTTIPSTTGCSGFPLVSRSQWRASSPSSITTISRPVPRVFVHHTGSASHNCWSTSVCSSKVREIQDYHKNSRGWSDIGYNFLIGSDGSVYEGRGWDTVGAQAQGWNSQSIGISMMGNFENSRPSSAALRALNNLIQCGVARGKLSSNYKLHGHRDGVCTECPGDALYGHVQTMSRYAGRLNNC